jgi:peptide/nickel transport system substrate-binding protein
LSTASLPDSIIRTMRNGVLIALMSVVVLLLSACSIPGFSDDDSTTGTDPEPPGTTEQSEPQTDPADPDAQTNGEVQQTLPDEAFQIDTTGDADLDTEPVDLIEGGLREPRTLNPVLVDDPLAEELSGLVFSGLTRIDPETSEPVPDLAESWEINEDETAYTFTIREDARWHDGQPVTAQDVEFTFELMMDIRTRSPRYSRIVERVTAVEALDTRTVEFRLLSPYAPLLSTIATFGIVPQHILLNVLPDELIAHPFGVSSAVGTGPFVFAFWNRGDQIVFEANRQHFRDVPQFDRYIYRMVPDADILLEELDQEIIDWARISPAQYADAAELSNVEVLGVPGYEMVMVALQLDIGQTGLFQDLALRQALIHALDREALIDDIWNGQASIAHGTIPPASWAATEVRNQYPYDPERAQQLLDEAGWAIGENGIRQQDGQPLQFELIVNGDNPVRQQLAEWLIDEWQAIGIDASVTFETWGDVRDRITTSRDFEALIFGYRWDVDPDQHAVWSSDSIPDAFNITGYVNADVDRLLDEALRNTDQSSRGSIYEQVQEIVVLDLPVLPLVFPDKLIAVGPGLQHVDTTAILLRNRANVSGWTPANAGTREDTDDE